MTEALWDLPALFLHLKHEAGGAPTVERVDWYDAGFSELGTIYILGQKILCCGGLSCTMQEFSIPDLYPLEMSSTPVMDDPKESSDGVGTTGFTG